MCPCSPSLTRYSSQETSGSDSASWCISMMQFVFRPLGDQSCLAILPWSENLDHHAVDGPDVDPVHGGGRLLLGPVDPSLAARPGRAGPRRFLGLSAAPTDESHDHEARPPRVPIKISPILFPPVI